MIPYLVIIAGGVIGLIVGGLPGLLLGLLGGFLLSNIIGFLAFRLSPARTAFGAPVRNALLAKATLTNGAPATNQAIEDRARRIYAGGGRWQSATKEGIADVDLQAMSEFESYSLCAAAMMELGMNPPVPEKWNPPPDNPFRWPVTQEVIDTQSEDLRERYGLSVTLVI